MSWFVSHIIPLALLVVLAVGFAMILDKGGELGRQLSDLRTAHYGAPTEGRKMQTLKATWVSNGVTHEVSTPQNTGEADDVHMARHQAKVALALAAYPPG